MPVDKAKVKGVSASSFFDLKAELSKHEEEFARNKAAGKSNVIVGGVPRAEKVCFIFPFNISNPTDSNRCF